MTTPPPSPPTAALEAEREALRIQAAAVAAQQAALTEVEALLDQRQAALEQQEDQLAAHLEARNVRLVQLQEKISEARQRLREEREAFVRERAARIEETARAAREADEAREQADAERQRLAALRRRYHRRWHQRFDQERERLERLRRQLDARRRAADLADVRLARDQQALAAAQRIGLGERELGRRQLADGWKELRASQRRWLQERARERAALSTTARRLEDRAAALAWAGRALDERRRHDRSHRALLEQEADGLENRVRNLRRKLPAPPATIEPAPVPASRMNPVASAAGGAEWMLGWLERQADTLADERLLLVEHLARLVHACHGWRTDQQAVVAHLEASARELERRESTLGDRERTIELRSMELGRQEQSALHSHHQLEAMKAQVRLERAARDGERARLLARVHGREVQLDARSALLTEWRRRWGLRRRHERDRLQAELLGLQAVRGQYAQLVDGTILRAAELERQARAQAERGLALEEYRLQLLAQSPDAVRAERRIEHLRRRWTRLFEASERALERDRLTLRAESVQLHRRATLVEKQTELLLDREADLSRRTTAAENRKARADAARARLERQVRGLRAQRQVQDRHLHEVRTELERVMLVLLGNDPGPEATVMRAA
jgi:hypothetical protein